MEHLYWHLLTTACIAFGGLAVLLLLARFGKYSDVMMLIFFAGAVGAVVNNYYRLATLSTNTVALQAAALTDLVVIQMYVSLLVAGILAFVAYGLFLSGLVQGSLFPVFEKTQESYQGVTALLMNLAPKTNLDAAKAILWAFIAGFSERFVPNIIDALINKSATG